MLLKNQLLNITNNILTLISSLVLQNRFIGGNVKCNCGLNLKSSSFVFCNAVIPADDKRKIRFLVKNHHFKNQSSFQTSNRRKTSKYHSFGGGVQ